MGVEEAAEYSPLGRQLILGAGFESHSEGTLNRVQFGNIRWLETPRTDHHREQEIGTQRFDLEVSLSIRRGALAAIRIAAGSGVTTAYARPGGVNEYSGAGDGVTLCTQDAADQV